MYECKILNLKKDKFNPFSTLEYYFMMLVSRKRLYQITHYKIRVLNPYIDSL